MKKIIIMLMVLGLSFATIPAFAYNVEVFDETELGAKVDFPDLIKITTNSSIGVEAGVNSIYEDWMDNSFAFIKFTSHFSIIDFTKK